MNNNNISVSFKQNYETFCGILREMDGVKPQTVEHEGIRSYISETVTKAASYCLSYFRAQPSPSPIPQDPEAKIENYISLLQNIQEILFELRKNIPEGAADFETIHATAKNLRTLYLKNDRLLDELRALEDNIPPENSSLSERLKTTVTIGDHIVDSAQSKTKDELITPYYKAYLKQLEMVKQQQEELATLNECPGMDTSMADSSVHISTPRQSWNEWLNQKTGIVSSYFWGSHASVASTACAYRDAAPLENAIDLNEILTDIGRDYDRVGEVAKLMTGEGFSENDSKWVPVSFEGEDTKVPYVFFADAGRMALEVNDVQLLVSKTKEAKDDEPHPAYLINLGKVLAFELGDAFKDDEIKGRLYRTLNQSLAGQLQREMMLVGPHLLKHKLQDVEYKGKFSDVEPSPCCYSVKKNGNLLVVSAKSSHYLTGIDKVTGTEQEACIAMKRTYEIPLKEFVEGNLSHLHVTDQFSTPIYNDPASFRKLYKAF